MENSKRMRFYGLLLSFMFISNVVHAGINTWTGLGPGGMPVSTVAIDASDPKVIYVGTLGYGILCSRDEGSYWNAINTGLTDKNISVLAIDPAVPQTIYAGGQNKGIFKSIDGGNNWNSINADLYTGAPVESIVIDPINTNTIYLALMGHGMYKSTNGGESWTSLRANLGYDHVKSIVIDASDSQTLYVASEPDGVFKSTDGGMNWISSDDGFIESYRPQKLAVDPRMPSTLYVGTYGNGVFRSTNGGRDWSEININLTSRVILGLAIDPANSATLYACTFDGLFKSSNSGDSWEIVEGLASQTVRAIGIVFEDPETLYVGTDSGVYRSSDGGANWESANAGLGNSNIKNLAFDPFNPQALYAGASPGLFATMDSGANWDALSFWESTSIGYTIRSLAMDPTDSKTMYAGAEIPFFFKSTDGGTTWTSRYFGAEGVQSISAIAVAASSPQILYIGSYDHTFSGLSGKIFKSTDGGANWAASSTGLNLPPIAALAVDPRSQDRIYAVTGAAGVYKSTNSGESWIAINQGLENLDVTTLAVDSVNPEILYAGTITSGVFKSTDGGSTWISANSGINGEFILSIAINPLNHDDIYIGTSASGVFWSPDGGASWHAINSGLPAASVEALAITATIPQTIFAATYGRGVWAYSPYSDITVSSYPEDQSFSVDGQMFATPQTYLWPVGSIHSVSVASIQQKSDGTRYVFANWSDGGAMSHTIMVPAAATTYTANFKTQFQLTTTVSPAGGGSIIASPASVDGYYDAGSSVQFTAIANAGYSFSAWGGSMTGSVNPKTFTILAPGSVSASYLSVGRTRPSRLAPPTANHARIKRVMNSPRE